MKIHSIMAMLVALLMPVFAYGAGDDFYDHRVALQVSDNNPGTMTKVLNNAVNMTKAFNDMGETVLIRIVAYNQGIHLLRNDTSEVLDRVHSMSESMDNVSFVACGNTINLMGKKTGKDIQVTDAAEIVRGGVVELIQLDEAGWTILRP